jgi:hypothetical protein
VPGAGDFQFAALVCIDGDGEGAFGNRRWPDRGTRGNDAQAAGSQQKGGWGRSAADVFRAEHEGLNYPYK